MAQSVARTHVGVVRGAPFLSNHLTRFVLGWSSAGQLCLIHRRITHTGMKSARIFQQKQLAGLLEAREDGTYRFIYDPAFHGEPVSLTMPVVQRIWEFPRFPAPFEGLLPEGVQLDALLRLRKLDRGDLFGQLLAVGGDVVGSLRIEEAK
jgi:HipA N-terminal domain